METQILLISSLLIGATAVNGQSTLPPNIGGCTLQFLPRGAMLAWYMLWPCVRTSVVPSVDHKRRSIKAAKGQLPLGCYPAR